MKKIFALILAAIMLFSSFTASAADKKYVGDVLAQIQTQTGFVPNKTSIVTGNCYAFVSAVCEKLYGVKYQEGLNSNGYTCRHDTGLFYTVSTYVSKSSDTSDCVNDIVNFFVNNAYPGDIVHYSSLSGSTHTFMIQSIDSEKMAIFHSNYQTRTLPSTACHIDNIYWSSFKANPTKTIYNDDGSIYSHNSIFYNKQKRGGLGITINRYKDYDKLYYPSFAPPTLSASNSATEAIKLKWTKVEGASKYCIQYKKAGASNYSTLTNNCTAVTYDVKNLELGEKYDFRVCAYAGGKWRDYSNVVRKEVLPPQITKVTFIPGDDGLSINWKKRDDVDGVKLYKSNSANGSFSLVRNFSKTATSYVDNTVKYGVSYYYKLERYKTEKGKTYSSTSKAFEGKYVLKTPEITYVRKNTKTIQFTFNGDGYQSSFDYSVEIGKGDSSGVTVNTKENTLLLENLKIGETYTVLAREKTDFGTGDFGKLTLVAAPRPVTGITATARKKGIRIDYNTQDDVNGYYIYRKGAKGYELIATINNKATGTYLDRKISYNTPYKYLVKAYALSESGKQIEGDAGQESAEVKMYLTPPAITVTCTTPKNIKVSWKAVTAAQKYELQYRVKGGKWKTVSNIKKKSYTVKKLKLGKKYFFRVKSINSFGSSVYSAKTKRKMLPPTPARPTVKEVNSGLKITFKPQKYAYCYDVYRATKKKGKYRYIATVSGHKTKSYTDKYAPNSKCYYKLICKVKRGGKIYKSVKSAAANKNTKQK